MIDRQAKLLGLQTVSRWHVRTFLDYQPLSWWLGWTDSKVLEFAAVIEATIARGENVVFWTEMLNIWLTEQRQRRQDPLFQKRMLGHYSLGDAVRMYNEAGNFIGVYTCVGVDMGVSDSSAMVGFFTSSSSMRAEDQSRCFASWSRNGQWEHLPRARNSASP